jgi:subtilisin family serine protease
MKRHISALLALLMIICLVLSASAAAQPTSGGTRLRRVSPAGSSLAGDPDLLKAHGWNGPLAHRSGMVSAVIELADAPTTLVYAAATQRGAILDQANVAAQNQLRQIDQAQQGLLGALAGLNAQVLYRTQRVYNGIAVRVDASKLAAIIGLPGVAAIHPLVTKHLLNSGSVPLIGAPQVWDGVSGKTGTGIKIAIIDTGIDYIHADFGGSGNYTGVTDTSAPAFTAKVVGGKDFAGDAYDADSGDLAKFTPHPDANPIDCLSDPTTVGHGTHVAGTAAGFGVQSNGTTYSGPYGNTTPFNTLRIGPGVAPGALLVALRVFGCQGSTNVVDQALEYAVDPNGDGNFADRVDVINMSLGSDYGYLYDSTTIASENAAHAGVVVVASAGNSFDTNYITGSPATGDSVISVASSSQSDSTQDGITVNAPAAIAGGQPASFSVAYDWDNKPDVTGNVFYPATNRSGCVAFTGADATGMNGKVALLDWTDGACSSVTRTGNVVAAGGIGAILVDNSELFDLAITGSTVIPAVSMPKQIGDLLKAHLAGLNVTFSKTLRASQHYQEPLANDTLSSFSSRGPRRGDSVLKPDITAPGQNIFSARVGSANEGETLSGTSMAAPHVTGTMAILRQIHPTWTPQQLKALVMNTATKDIRSDLAADSQIYGPARIGAGRVNVPNAASDGVIAFDTAKPNRVSVSFGNVEVASTKTLTRTVSVVNKGASSATFDISYTPITTIPGVSYTLVPASVTLAASETKTVTVQMHADSSLMKHTRDSTESATQAGDPREWISDASGFLTLTPQAAVRNFTANVRGYYENPPTNSAFHATGTFTYTSATNTLSYSISFNSPITLSSLGGHIHRGAAGTNGPIVVGFAGTPSATLSSISGSVTLSAPDSELLLKGGLYVNFHTAASPNGELRGQIVAQSPTLRLPIYAVASPASTMHANGGAFSHPIGAGGTTTGTFTLAGSGLNGATQPTDTLSLVSAFELQYISPALTASTAITRYSDLQYVGVNSDYGATGSVASSTILFGIATQGNWSSPNEPYFEIDIDTNNDDIADYALFTTNSGTSDANDDVFTMLFTVGPNSFTGEYALNILDSSVVDTHLFNSNVVILGVDATDLGLTTANNTFTYQVFSDTNVEDSEQRVFDYSPPLTYSITKPGISFENGLFDLPIYADLPSRTIHYTYNRADLGNHGVLLLHHHNVSGTRAEIHQMGILYLPFIKR